MNDQMALRILSSLKVSLCLAFLLNANAAQSADDLFAKTSIHPISIEISGTNLAALKDVRQQGNPHIYVRARIQEGDQVYENVGLRLKGNGSFRSLGDRPCLTVKFDEFIENQKFHGLTKIHFNNSLTDPAYMTMILCGELFNAARVPADRGCTWRIRSLGS